MDRLPHLKVMVEDWADLVFLSALNAPAEITIEASEKANPEFEVVA